jgi:hypothetical protein
LRFATGLSARPVVTPIDFRHFHLLCVNLEIRSIISVLLTCRNGNPTRRGGNALLPLTRCRNSHTRLVAVITARLEGRRIGCKDCQRMLERAVRERKGV